MDTSCNSDKAGGMAMDDHLRDFKRGVMCSTKAQQLNYYYCYVVVSNGSFFC